MTADEDELRQLVKVLYMAGLEYVASSRYGGYDVSASVSGYDSHGSSNLSAAQEDLLRSIMGMEGDPE